MVSGELFDIPPSEPPLIVSLQRKIADCRNGLDASNLSEGERMELTQKLWALEMAEARELKRLIEIRRP